MAWQKAAKRRYSRNPWHTRCNEDVDAEQEGGQGVADDVQPAPPNAVHEELPDESGGELGEADGGEVDELVAGQVLSVELPADVEKVVDAPARNQIRRFNGYSKTRLL